MPASLDDDGVATEVEDGAPHGGDGNLDGALDSEQANVASLPAAVDVDGNGLLDDYVTIESPAGTALLAVRAITVPTDPAPPEHLEFPVGLFDYEVDVADAGDQAAVTFHLPSGVVGHEANAEFWVVQNGRWTDLTRRTDADAVADEVTVTLVDGGAGDEDRSADGLIEDPGGPGIAQAAQTITVRQIANGPPSTFNYFLEECTETGLGLECTSQAPRRWIDPTTNQPAIPDPQAVTLAHGQTFTWGNLEYGRHYRIIQVATSTPPDFGLGVPDSPPISGLACDPAGRTVAEAIENSLTLALLPINDPEDGSDARWADCTVTNNISVQTPPDPRAGSFIVARKWGDRSIGGSNLLLDGATMGLWRDNGDGNFQPGGADGNAIQTCVTGTAGTGLCNFTNLASGGYWVREVSAPAGGVWNPIPTWAPGSSSIANPPVPYGAHRVGDPAADSGSTTDGFPLVVNGNPSDSETTDFFANRRTNPPMANLACNDLMRIVLVLDRSGSISGNGAANYENAALAFVNDLVGTNTEIGIVSFAATAQSTSPLGSGYQNVVGGPGTLLTTIGNVYDTLGGGTNWDAGLQLAAPFDPNPDLVVVVTDGNPTLNIIAPDSASQVNWSDFTEAVTSANRLKAGDGTGTQRESRVFVVGAGAAGTISVENIWGIAGPVTGQANILANDYLIGSAEALGDALRALALARCSASLDVEKLSVGGTETFDFTGSGAGVPATFTRNTAVANPTTNAPFTFTFSEFGVKDVRETPEPGWTLTNIACSANVPPITIGTGIGASFAQGATAGFDPGDTTVRADLGNDDNPTCTYTNTLQAATITVTKDAVPNDPQDFSFTTTGTGGGTLFASGTFLLDDDADGTLPASRTFTFTGADATGTKTITETVPPGWDLTALVCSKGTTNLATGLASIALLPGDAVTCTYTNTKRGNIIVDKVTVPAGDPQSFAFVTTGGTNPAYAGFSLTDAAAPNNQQLRPGSYSVTETVPTGWTLTALVCVDPSGGTTTTLATGVASITLAAGETVSCTYTNTLQAATITVTKDAVPNDPQDFSFTTTGTGGGTLFASGTFLLDDDADGTLPASRTFTFTGADATGTKTITETVPPGWDLTALVCSKGTTNLATGLASIALLPGDAVTCTYTNTKRGNIIVDKVTVPAGDPQSFAFVTTGGTNPAYAGFSLTDAAAPNNQQLRPGSYSVTETVPTGWTLTALVCVDPSGGTTTTLATGVASITLAAGETVSCTYTNTEQIQLVIEKVVVNDDGGSAVVGDFGITTDAGTLVFGSAVEDPTDTFTYTATTLEVAPGTYTLAELAVAGYEPSAWTCTNGDGGAFDAGSVTVAAGDDPVTCSITNDDQPVELVIEKVVVNDDGGGAVVGDFGITTDAGTLVFGSAVEDPTDTFTYTATTLEVAPGTYTLAELAVAGYEPSAWTCTNGDGGAFDAGSVTVAAGDDPVTCSITNDDQPVELVIEKVVVNDDGGGAVVGDFGITTDAGTLVFGSAVEDPTDTFTYTATTLEVAPGTYTLAELAVAGYEPSAWTCTNGDGGAFDAGSVTVAAGDDPVTCSITNDDQPVELVIEKVVVNDDGGGAVVGDFGITTDAGTLVFGSAVEDPTDTFTYTATTLEVAPGTYTLAELAVAGYEPSAWTCTNGDGGAFDAGSVTVAAGDDPVTCSITNDDQPVAPTLTLLKTVIGGTATADDFQPRIDGVDVEWGAANEVTAGDHVASEIFDLPGYEAYAWGGDCAPDGSVTLGPAEDLTCTIVNAFISLEVVKVADSLLIPPEGQDVTFTFTVTNASEVAVEISSLEDDVFGPLSGDADCQVGTILPSGSSCTFEETFLVASEVAPDGDPEQVFPPHVNTMTVCATLPAGAQAPAVTVAAAPPGCDDDPETVEFIIGGGVLPDEDSGALPDTDSGNGAPGTSPSGDPPIPWVAMLLTALIAFAAAGVTIGRRRREP